MPPEPLPPPKLPEAPPPPPLAPPKPVAPLPGDPAILPDAPPGGYPGDPRSAVDPNAAPGKMIIVGHSDAAITITSARVENIPGVTDVNLHGTPTSVQYDLEIGGKTYRTAMDAPTLLTRIQADGYQMGDPIRLMACETGDPAVTNNMAQQLADLTGGPVSAPSKLLDVGWDGKISIRDGGVWKVYSPTPRP